MNTWEELGWFTVGLLQGVIVSLMFAIIMTLRMRRKNRQKERARAAIKKAKEV